MSEEEVPKPPKPTAKTSTVPLKKETVRISLRARPGEGITQPKKETSGSPTAQGAAVPAPGSKPPIAKGSTSKVPETSAAAPAPSVALKLPKAVAPPPPPAATTAPPPPSAVAPAPPTAAPVTPAPVTPAPVAPAPAPPSTISLKTASAGGGATSAELKKTQKVTVKALPSAPPGGAPPAAAKTVPLAAKKAAAVGAGTQALPKATVKLQQPGQGSGQPSGAIDTSSAILLEDEDAESGLLPFAIAVTVLSLVALIVSMMTSDVVGLGVPKIKNVSWEKNTGTGWTSTFASKLPEVPVYK